MKTLFTSLFMILLVSNLSAQQNNNMEEYKIILKRPVVTNQQDMADKASIKELVEFERFCRDNGLWNEMKKYYADHSDAVHD